MLKYVGTHEEFGRDIEEFECEYCGRHFLVPAGGDICGCPCTETEVK